LLTGPNQTAHDIGEHASAGLGVEVFGQVMTIGQEMLLVAGLGALLFAGAVWAFRRQE
jgi:hypothetical protein